MAQPPFQFRAGYHPPTQHPNGNAQFANMQTQGQTAPAQPALMQQANLPADVDMSILQNISPEQLAAIARMFQAGALQMPPSIPNAPPHAQTTAPTLPTAHSFASGGRSNPARGDIDMDAEEGEVDESGEEYTPTQPRDFLRPPPTGPKNRSVSPRGRAASLKRQKSPKPPSQPKSASMNKPFPAQAIREDIKGNKSTGASRVSKEDGAKLFVRELIAAGYSYEDLLAEVGSQRQLDRLFHKLNLAIPARRVTSQTHQMTGSAPTVSQAELPLASSLVSEDVGKTAPIKRPAPAKAAPVDRSEYLAKLQAAKKRKSEATAVSPVPAPERNVDKPPASTPPVMKAELPSSDGGLSMDTRPPTSKSVNMTELARKKLEALRASQAANANANRSTASSPPANSNAQYVAPRQNNPSPPGRGLGDGIAEIAPRVAQTLGQPLQTVPSQPSFQPQPTSSPMPEPARRSFSGLPGLFMIGSSTKSMAPAVSVSPQPTNTTTPAKPGTSPVFSQKQSGPVSSKSQALFGTPTASPGPLTVPRKRPVASDFDLSYKPTPPKKPFGQSRNGSEDESLIIQASDDEDEDEMVIDQADDSSPKPATQTKSFREVGPLRDFPSKPTFVVPTSAARTPDGITYEQKMKEIEEFRRKIAEREMRQKANGNATPTKSDALVTGPVSTASTPKTEAPAPGVPASRSSEFILPNSTVTKQELKEKLRKRLLQLEQERIQRAGQDKAVGISEHEPESQAVMSGALPPMQSSDDGSTTQVQSLPQAPQEAVISVGSDLEEGELSDDSSSNFYETEAAQDEGNGLAVRADGSRVDSHSTNASATTSTQTIQEARSGIATEAGADSTFGFEPTEGLGTANTQVGLLTPLESHPESLAESVEEDGDTSDPLMIDDEQQDENDGSSGGSMVEDAGDGVDVYDDDDESGADDMDLDEESPAEQPNQKSVHSSSSPASSPDLDPVPQPQIAVSDTRNIDDSIDDDLAPELQPTNEELAATLNQDSITVQHAPTRYFTPYRSPLEGFKDYRYHHDYLTTVSGGHQSLTYSHNIDAENALCPYETAGGRCNDQACQFQHFRTMAVTDNELLQNMGAKNTPTRTAEDRERWNSGISLLIRKLRESNPKPDAASIAAKIAEFRRAFTGDPTKVLDLGLN